MAIQNFEELNILKRHSLPYVEYFGDMQLTETQKKNRKDLALILEDILTIIFELIYVESSLGFVDKTVIRQEFINQIYENIDNEEFFEDEEQFEDYLFDLMDEMIDQTIKNLEEKPNDYDYTGETPYWVSNDRAQFVAENEANTLYNTREYKEAKEQGLTHKVWMAYPDNRVRPTHIDANGLKVPIGSYFEVGEAQMLYPKDVSSKYSTGAEHPEEVINCRCTIKYV